MFQAEPAIPILRIFDESLMRAFYLDYAGFEIDWEHRFASGMPLYCQVSRGSLRLHLSEHVGDASPGARIFVPATGLEAYLDELRGKQWRLLRPSIEKRDWGIELELIDPFGNRLTFTDQQSGA